MDEAHCISEWGHEFRPDYRSLGLLRSEFPAVPIAAFTATATRQVQEDVVRLLGLRSPFVVRASFDRPEIFYRVAAKQGTGKARCGSSSGSTTGEPGIVYRGTRKAVEKTALYLSGHGVRAVAYHAGLDDEDRRLRQEAFVRDEVTVVVATIAFGMGIDKSNVRWVVHGDLPRSVEGYYQETGRAARDGEDADTVLFYGPADIAVDPLAHRADRIARGTGARRGAPAGDPPLRRRTGLPAHPASCAFRREPPRELRPLRRVHRAEAREDMTVAAQKVLSAAVRTGERFGAHHLADILVGNATDKVLERGHQTLPTFGVGRDRDKGWWLSLIRELDAGDYLVRGEGRLAGFHLSDRGRLLLRGKESFFASAGTVREPAVETPLMPAPPAASPEELFLCLKQVRRRIAESRDVPPYIVFSDKTLRAMAKDQPTDPAGLLRCPGVGDRKLAVYGGDFLKAIRSFLRYGGMRAMRVHYFQHVPFEGLGSIAGWLESRSARVTSTRFFEDSRLPGVTDIDWLVVLGGPMSANDEETRPWLSVEKRFIAEAVAGEKVVLGICLGAQLIASALGARVYPNPQPEIGWFPIERTRPGGLALPARADVFHWHGETFDLPPGALGFARERSMPEPGVRHRREGRRIPVSP